MKSTTPAKINPVIPTTEPTTIPPIAPFDNELESSWLGVIVVVADCGIALVEDREDVTAVD